MKSKKVQIRFLYSTTYAANSSEQPCFTISVSGSWLEMTNGAVQQSKLQPSYCTC